VEQAAAWDRRASDQGAAEATCALASLWAPTAPMFMYCGEWERHIAYEVDDVVTQYGFKYRCERSHWNEDPQSHSGARHWVRDDY
jgi:hypothetical protein